MTLDINHFSGLRDKDLSRDGVMIGEGRLLVERMLASGCEMIGLLCSPDWGRDMESLVDGRCPIQLMPENEISELAGFPFHRGVMAAAHIPILPDLTKWEHDCFCDTEPRATCRFVICPAVNDPENLGSIYRCAAALGWDAIILGTNGANPFSRRALRASMGASLGIPTIQINEPGELESLQERGFLILGTSIKETAQELTHLAHQLGDLGRLNRETVPIALMFGNEFLGLTPEWEAVCTRLVRIPMFGETDSLNIAVAAGIFMYELGPRLV